jgi:hypothetical protein
MTVRTQYAVPSNLIASLAAAGTGTVSMNRPRTLPVEGNTLDHVARPYRRQEFEGGLAACELNAISAVAGISLKAVEVLRWDGSVARTVLSTTLDTAYLGNAVITADLLKRLLLAEDEAGVRLTLKNTTGGPIVNVGATARFDFGLHNANYGSNQGL